MGRLVGLSFFFTGTPSHVPMRKLLQNRGENNPVGQSEEKEIPGLRKYTGIGGKKAERTVNFGKLLLSQDLAEVEDGCYAVKLIVSECDGLACVVCCVLKHSFSQNF